MKYYIRVSWDRLPAVAALMNWFSPSQKPTVKASEAQSIYLEWSPGYELDEIQKEAFQDCAALMDKDFQDRV